VIPGYEVEIVEHPIEVVLNRLSDSIVVELLIVQIIIDLKLFINYC